MSEATAEAQGCPDDIFNSDDGVELRDKDFLPLLEAGLNRSIDVLNSDGEVFIGLMSHKDPDAPAECYNYSLDAVSLADYEASGSPNWLTFFSEWRVRLTNGWSAAVMGDSKHGGDPGLRDVVFKDAKFSMYQGRRRNFLLCGILT